MSKISMRYLLVVAFVCVIPSTGFAFKVGADAEKGARFRVFPVRFSIARDNNTTSITDDSEVVAASRALETWSHVPVTLLAFRLQPHFFAGTCQDAFTQNKNIICFLTKAQILAITGQAITATTAVLGGSKVVGGNFVSGFVMLNEEDFSFRTSTFDPDDRTKYDLQAAITQGVSAVIGLAQSATDQSVTNRNFKTEQSLTFRSLHEDDIQGAEFLYPPLDAFPGVNCNHTNDTTTYPWTGLGLFVVLWLALAIRLKKILALAHKQGNTRASYDTP